MRKTLVIASLCSFFLFMVISYTFVICTEKQDHKAETEEKDIQVVRMENKITENTKIVYQYFYTADRVTKEQTEQAPVFLQGLDMEQVKSVYQGWQIVLFSPETLILRCRIEGLSSETYILGEQDGFVSVFYEDAQKMIRLKEKTELPLSVLPEEEALRLKEGIHVVGEENLAKILSDLSS